MVLHESERPASEFDATIATEKVRAHFLVRFPDGEPARGQAFLVAHRGSRHVTHLILDALGEKIRGRVALKVLDEVEWVALVPDFSMIDHVWGERDSLFKVYGGSTSTRTFTNIFLQKGRIVKGPMQ